MRVASNPCSASRSSPSHPRMLERKSFATPYLVSCQCLFCLPIGYADIIMASQARRSVSQFWRAGLGKHKKSRVPIYHRDALLLRFYHSTRDWLCQTSDTVREVCQYIHVMQPQRDPTVFEALSLDGTADINLRR
jgi:hypothetical protein